MNRLHFFILAITLTIVACQSEKPDGDEEATTKSQSELDYERAQRISGNQDKPLPVTSDYLNAANCDSFAYSITYTQHVQPVVDTRCAISACHDAVTKANGIDMTGYANTRNAFEHLPGLCSIMHDFERKCRHMPTAQIKLPDRHVNMILCWAKNGYAE